jgi:two-component system sensor histidine kinase QseC
VKSIRRQLVFTLVACLAVLFACASTALFIYARGALLDQFDGTLAARIRSFTEMAEVNVEGGEISFELEITEFPLPEYQPSADAEYYQVWRHDGTILARSPSLDGKDLPRIAAGESDTRLVDVALPDGRRGRAAVLRFFPAPEPGKEIAGFDARAPEHGLVMVTARSREDLDAALSTLLAGFALMGVLLALALVVTVRWSVGRGLAPLEGIAGEAAAIGSADLSHRFRIDDLPGELVPIAGRLNELLGRIEEAFRRERRFSADVAHELRTPIAELRVLAEVALKREPAAGDASRAGFGDVLAIAKQMEQMVTALLSLVRCEAGRGEVQSETVDFAALIRKAAAPFQPRAQERNCTLELDLPDEAAVLSDPTLLGSIVTNLISNAVSHTPGGGSIRCGLTVEDGVFRLRLQNTNDTLTGDDLEHIFEPFWQKDASRTDASRNGLGLSIVAAYAGLLGLEPAASLPREDLFEISIQIPAGA